MSATRSITTSGVYGFVTGFEEATSSGSRSTTTCRSASPAGRGPAQGRHSSGDTALERRRLESSTKIDRPTTTTTTSPTSNEARSVSGLRCIGIIVVAFGAVRLHPGCSATRPSLGLDLQGGISVTLAPVGGANDDEPRSSSVDRIRDRARAASASPSPTSVSRATTSSSTCPACQEPAEAFDARQGHRHRLPATGADQCRSASPRDTIDDVPAAPCPATTPTGDHDPGAQ